MISLNFANLSSFILQYIVATLAAIFAFAILQRRKFYSKPEFILKKERKGWDIPMELLGMSFFSSLENLVIRIAAPNLTAFAGFASAKLPESEFRSAYRKGEILYPSPQFIRRDRGKFKAPSSRIKLPEIFYRRGVYDAFTALFSISVWAGILLLLTPYTKIFIFIPHFASLAVNLTLIIVLSITIFEGAIATIFFFIGTNIKRVAVIMLSVLGIFSAALLTPSFNWFHTYTTQGELLVYSILAVLILGITFLISLFKDKNVLFRLSLYSSFVSYGFFITVTAYNIFLTMAHSL